MRQSFNHDVPIAEQIKRIIKIARGHKHMHKVGPGVPPKKANPFILAGVRKLKKRVAAYWKGETDEHP